LVELLTNFKQHIFSLFSDLKRKVVVRFVDIGGIVSSSLRGSNFFFKVKGSGPFTFKP
jgi:hypothetical protein